MISIYFNNLSFRQYIDVFSSSNHGSDSHETDQLGTAKLQLAKGLNETSDGTSLRVATRR